MARERPLQATCPRFLVQLMPNAVNMLQHACSLKALERHHKFPLQSLWLRGRAAARLGNAISYDKEAGEVICSLLRRGGEVACPAPHAARNLGLAMRSPPNLFLGSVLEDALGKHVSLSKMPAELLFSLASPH